MIKSKKTTDVDVMMRSLINTPAELYAQMVTEETVAAGPYVYIFGIPKRRRVNDLSKFSLEEIHSASEYSRCPDLRHALLRIHFRRNTKIYKAQKSGYWKVSFDRIIRSFEDQFALNPKYYLEFIQRFFHVAKSMDGGILPDAKLYEVTRPYLDQVETIWNRYLLSSVDKKIQDSNILDRVLVENDLLPILEYHRSVKGLKKSQIAKFHSYSNNPEKG